MPCNSWLVDGALYYEQEVDNAASAALQQQDGLGSDTLGCGTLVWFHGRRNKD